MLKTEQNTTVMDHRVRAAFLRSKHCQGKGTFDTAFEHGQWWISCKNGAQFSVVDAEGGESINGFDFEEVTPPDED